jgi:4-hydroxy-2-oxoheptanedioate aldolase
MTVALCTIKQRLVEGATVTLVNPNYPASGLVETLCRAGADAVLIDCEHGPFGMESVEDMVRALADHALPEPWRRRRSRAAGA